MNIDYFEYLESPLTIFQTRCQPSMRLSDDWTDERYINSDSQVKYIGNMNTSVDLVDTFVQSGYINLTAHISAFGVPLGIYSYNIIVTPGSVSTVLYSRLKTTYKI